MEFQKIFLVLAFVEYASPTLIKYLAWNADPYSQIQ